MADEFGCRYLQAVGPYEGTLADAAPAFAALCDRAAAHGLLVGVEFLPFTNIRTAAEAKELLDATDRPNGGLLRRHLAPHPGRQRRRTRSAPSRASGSCACR